MKPNRGFTLIEVLLAVMLLALLLAGTYGAIRTAVRATHSGEAAIDRTNRLRVAQEFIRRQIGRIMPLAYDKDETPDLQRGGQTQIVFEGRHDRIRFVAPMPGYLSKGGPYVQTMSFEGGRGGGRRLVFRNAMLNGYDPKKKGDDEEPAILIDQIADGRFEFRTLDEEGKLTDWSDRWEDPGLTPVMVRVQVRMQPEAKIEFPDMDIPMMLDVGAVRRVYAPNMPQAMEAAGDGRRLEQKR